MLKYFFYGAILCIVGCGAVITHTEPTRVAPTIYTTPALPAVEDDMRVVCLLPESNGISATYAFGITDVFESAGPADNMEVSKVLLTPCNPFRIYCVYKEHGKKEVTTLRDIEPVGDCGHAR